MSLLTQAYAAGNRDALARFKLAAPAPTHPAVKGNPLLNPKGGTPPPNPAAQQALQAPTNPYSVKQVFDAAEQGKTRLEPNMKVSGERCTTCRQEKHYGPCLKPKRTRPDGEPLKKAGFNLGIKGDDPSFVGSGPDAPSVSPHYHSATSDSSLARARGGRPADEQAATGFADLFRHNGIVNPADEWVNASNALNKTALSPATNIHSSAEDRGPTTNIYEQIRVPGKAPVVGIGAEGKDQIQHAFDQVDCAVDSSNMEGGWGGPAGGPAVLG